MRGNKFSGFEVVDASHLQVPYAYLLFEEEIHNEKSTPYRRGYSEIRFWVAGYRVWNSYKKGGD